MKTSAISKPQAEAYHLSISSLEENQEKSSIKHSELKIEVLKELIGENMEAIRLLNSLSKDIDSLKHEEKRAELDEWVRGRNRDLRTLIDPQLLIEELQDKSGIPFHWGFCDKHYELLADQEMLQQGLELFLKVNTQVENIDVSFDYAGGRGVLKLDFGTSILEHRKELALLNSIMQSNEGFIMEESDALHLVFAVKGKYSHLTIS